MAARLILRNRVLVSRFIKARATLTTTTQTQTPNHLFTRPHSRTPPLSISTPRPPFLISNRSMSSEPTRSLVTSFKTYRNKVSAWISSSTEGKGLLFIGENLAKGMIFAVAEHLTKLFLGKWKKVKKLEEETADGEKKNSGGGADGEKKNEKA